MRRPSESRARRAGRGARLRWVGAALGVTLTALGGCSAAPEERTNPIFDACLIDGDAPQSIAEAMERVNALPRPLSVACFVASLPRPLSLVTTNSPFSAQPAEGTRSPRIFILNDGLVLSVVPEGDGHRLLEFAEWVTPTRTIKGEIPFPVEETLANDAPYDILFSGGGTTCSHCHRNESPAEGRPGAFVSDAMRPAPGFEAPVSNLFDEHATCDWTAEPARCEFLSALLDFGPIEEGAFDDQVDTFFE